MNSTLTLINLETIEIIVKLGTILTTKEKEENSNMVNVTKTLIIIVCYAEHGTMILKMLFQETRS